MPLNGLRKVVLGVEPYIPGKSTEEVMAEKGLKNVIKLGSNENPYSPFKNAMEAMKNEVSRLNTYPDVSFHEIREKIAAIYGLKASNICISHGAEGMLQTMGKVFIDPGDEVIIPTSTYGLYSEISKVMGAEIVDVPMKEKYYIDIDAIISKVNSKTKLLWLSNPNNPTGTVFEKQDLERLFKKLPSHCWVILDEAYAEFADQELMPDIAALINSGVNMISIRTFSKAYGLAGARLGYAVCREEMSVVIDTVTEPFNANRVGIAGALATLKYDSDEYLSALTKIKAGREWITAELRKMGLSPVSSQTNFVFVDTPFNAGIISEKLLDRGIIIRPCTGWNYPNAVRITVGKKEQNELLIEELGAILEIVTEEAKQ